MRRWPGHPGWHIRLVALACLSAVGAVEAADRLPRPPMAPFERGTYRARDLRSGEPLWEQSWVLRQEMHGVRPILHLEEHGQGIRESTVPTRWAVTMTIDLWAPAPRVTSTRQVWDLAGQPTTVEERTLAYGPGTGEVRIRDLRTGADRSRTFRVTAETVTPEMLPMLVRLLPETPGRQRHFDLVTRGGSFVGLNATIVGQERVEVPAGAYDCFKIELEPTGIVGILARLVLPRIYLWHAVAAPHMWVKFQGPAAGPGSAEIIRELSEFQAAAHPAE